mmetsp:Transcript_37974/g.77293  ORF Transcript_37974/g.77293 Transcript_37974/m.77293 type:complete len:248 (+) Transcript_37974:789-1532(+)
MQCPGYPRGKLEAVLSQSLCCKARLLHYFPPPHDDDDDVVVDGRSNDATKTTTTASTTTAASEDDTDYSTWCGWHNDHGSLTGLVPAMFLDSNGNEVPCPDPSAGLYIKSRSGDLVRVEIPPDALAFQVGETTQIHTGGILQATPHAVRGCSGGRSSGRSSGSGGSAASASAKKGRSGGGISRETFAVFMEPEYHGDMDIPGGRTVDDTQKREAEVHLPRSVRVLRSRWKEGMNFGEFSDATFAAFH